VIELETPKRPSRELPAAAVSAEEGLALARAALERGDYAGALEGARSLTDGDATEARLVAARALVKLERFEEAAEELRRAVHADPLTPRVHLDLGFAAARVGDFATARASWEHFLRLSPGGAEGARARSSLDALTRLMNLLEVHADG
jgi:Flp pilus assembly protein TadD